MFALVTRLIGGAVSPLVDQLTSFGASFAKKLALFLVAGLCLGVTLLALTLAFAFWIDELAGPVVAALAVAGLYLLVAIGAVVAALRSGRRVPAKAAAETQEDEDPAEPSRSARIDQFTAPILEVLQRLGLRREQVAVLVGASLAKRLRPVPLVGLAILAGFLIGRMWKGWDTVMSSNIVATLLGLVGLAGRRGGPEPEGGGATA